MGAISTLIDLYTAYLFDANKEESPVLFPSDFSHFVNKAVNQYLNKNYSTRSRLQQDTDDLRAIATSITINGVTGAATDKEGNTANIFSNNSNITNFVATPFGINFDLPSNYYHSDSFVVNFNLGRNNCDGNAITRNIRVKRLTADKFANIVDNVFQRPDITARRPRAYYYIQGNKVELRFGGTGSVVNIYFDYLKEPLEYNLTEAQLNTFNSSGVDNSQILEFSNYVNYEILREVNTLVLARDRDPALQTIPVVSQSVIKNT